MSNQNLYIGVDGGGTKTHFVCMRGDGVVMGEVFTGSSNVNSVGRDVAFKNFEQGINETLRKSNVTKENITAVGIGMAGVDTPEEVEDRKNWVYKTFSRNVITNIRNDGVIALISGTKKPYGIVVISGTGSIVLGMNQDKVYRSSGWGPILGDEGSGFCIAQFLLKAVCHNEDGGPDTILKKMVLDELKLPSVRSIIDWTYKDVAWARFAALTPLVFKAAKIGDKVALEILEDNANGIIRNLKLVYEKGGFKNSKTPLVFSGGNLTHDNGNGIYAQILKQKIMKEFDNIEILLPTLSAPVAAAYLAMETKPNSKL
jgi:N-acetylglucosamine kinase-like BadF-type ATPase